MIIGGRLVRPYLEVRGVQKLSGLSPTKVSLQIKRHAALNDYALNMHEKNEVTMLLP